MDFNESHFNKPSRFEFEGDYCSYVSLPPPRDMTIAYLKGEIDRAASLNTQKKLTIGIGVAHLHDKVFSLAKEASKRKELSDKLTNREIEIELRKYAQKFPNVVSVSLDTKPTHRAMMPIFVLGNYCEN